MHTSFEQLQTAHCSTKPHCMALWVNYRPDTVSSPVVMSLNPEPAAPEEREAHHLPPKSFADAAQEALEPQSHVNGTDGAAERDNVKTDAPKANGVSVLRIVDTGAHRDDEKDSSKDSASIQDQESYEGTGIEDSPKSPKGKTHRRKGSRSSLGSIGRTYGVSLKNGLKDAANELQDEATKLKNDTDGTRDKMENEGRQKLDDIFLQEQPRRINGDALTTMKPSNEAGKGSRIDRPLKRRDSELKAGRQAGAGWAKSKYVRIINFANSTYH